MPVGGVALSNLVPTHSSGSYTHQRELQPSMGVPRAPLPGMFPVPGLLHSGEYFDPTWYGLAYNLSSCLPVLQLSTANTLSGFLCVPAGTVAWSGLPSTLGLVVPSGSCGLVG